MDDQTMLVPNLQILGGFTAIAFAISFVLTAVARIVAPRIGLVDKPDGSRKLHSRATPLMGGVAVFLAFAFAAIAYAASLHESTDLSTHASRFQWPLLASGALICCLGLCDDKWALRPKHKFIGQIVASLPYVAWGPQVHALDLCGISVPLSVLGPVFTIFWFTACTNVINLVDGLDGLASSLGLIASLAIAIMAAMTGHYEITALGLLFAASLSGFLVHNWPPAKIFLGDAGSLTIGFVLGALTLEAYFKKAAFQFAIPFVVMSLPAFDTFMAIVRRKLNGKGIGDADRGHIHHRLQDHGLSRPQVLMAMIGICTVMCVGAIGAVYLRNDGIGIAICISVLSLLVIGRVFGYDETVLFFRHLEAIRHVILESSTILSSRFILTRTQHSPSANTQTLWNHLCDRIQAMGGSQITCCLNETGATMSEALATWEWSSKDATETGNAKWTFCYEVDRGSDILATIHVSGTGQQPAKGQRMDDLFRWCDTFCQNCTVDGMFEADEMPDVIKFPTNDQSDDRTSRAA